MIHRFSFLCPGLLLLIACSGESSPLHPVESARVTQSTQNMPASSGFGHAPTYVPPPLPVTTLPTSDILLLETSTEWTTDIHISTECESSPEVFTVTKGHGGPADCEALIAFAAMDNHGDYFDSGGHLTWMSSDSDIVSIDCTQASHGRVCWLTGYKDLFDMPNQLEPSATIQACSHNVCPPQPSEPECKKYFCTEFEVTSILSVEVQWTVMHDFGKEDFIFAPEQDGRRFQDDWSSVRNGLVSESSVGFQRGEILYKGFVLPDRKTMYGSAWEASSMTHLGSWIAQSLLTLCRQLSWRRPVPTGAGFLFWLALRLKPVYTRPYHSARVAQW